eukprot:jgi/Psemu1/221084/e_gw1.1087.13.1
MTLVDPKFLGAGGGGSVWTMKQQKTPNKTTNSPSRNTAGGRDENEHKTANDKNDVVVKISWSRSTDSVRNECDVLRVLERRGVTGVERCLGATDYRYDPDRVVIVMQPLVVDDNDNTGNGSITASLDDLSLEMARVAARKLGTTAAQMIAAGVVTTDVQPLISKTTGDVLLIDLTEARVIVVPTGEGASIADGDRLLTNAFFTEIQGLIPESLLDDASEAFRNELRRIEADTGMRIPGSIREILDELPIAAGGA